MNDLSKDVPKDDPLDSKDSLKDTPKIGEQPNSFANPKPRPEDKSAGQKAAKPEGKGMKTFRRIVRWSLSALILFALGALLVTFLFYVPLQQSIDQRQSGLQAELQSANQKVETLQAQVDQKTGLENQSKELQASLDRANLQVYLLQAREDVLAAQLALAENQVPRAKVALTQTTDTLTKLAGLMPADQRKVVEDMQTRLKLILGELEKDKAAAKSDLEVLRNNLLELEDALVE